VIAFCDAHFAKIVEVMAMAGPSCTSKLVSPSQFGARNATLASTYEFSLCLFARCYCCDARVDCQPNELSLQVNARVGANRECTGAPQDDTSGTESVCDMIPTGMTFGLMMGANGFPMGDLCTCLCKEVATEWELQHTPTSTSDPSHQQPPYHDLQGGSKTFFEEQRRRKH
jgi:hypothetical protein